MAIESLGDAGHSLGGEASVWFCEGRVGEFTGSGASSVGATSRETDGSGESELIDVAAEPVLGWGPETCVCWDSGSSEAIVVVGLGGLSESGVELKGLES